MGRKVNVGVIGLGIMGQGHLKTLKSIQSCKVAAICDSESWRFDALKKEKLIDENVKCFTDYKELIKNGGCECVAVVTPHPFHLTISEFAFNAGLHVMCDKPITVTVAEADRMIAAWKDGKNLKFSTMYTLRTKPHNRIIKEWITSGKLGAIRRVEMTCTTWLRTQKYYSSQPWRGTWKGEGGGLLLNQAPHDLDLISWLFGPCRSIWAKTARRFHKIETEDEVIAVLTMGKGFPVTFYATTGEAPGKNYIEIVGDKGTLIKNDKDLIFRKLPEPVSKIITGSSELFPVVKSEDIKIDIPAESDGNRIIFEELLDAIIHNRPNKTLTAPGNDGIHSVEFANAMLMSSLTGKEVSLPINRKSYNALFNKFCNGKISL